MQDKSTQANTGPGDFQVDPDCCTACGVPWHYAPRLFEFNGNTCNILKQPENESEIARMIWVMATQDTDCIRYTGTDKNMRKRLSEGGVRHDCFEPLDHGQQLVRRTRVHFHARTRRDAVDDEAERRLAESIRLAILSRPSPTLRWLIGPARRIRLRPDRLQLKIWETTTGAAGYRSLFRRRKPVCVLRIRRSKREPGWYLVDLQGPWADLLSIEVHETLTAMRDQISGVRWYSRKEWSRGMPGTPTPR